jgi:hypothetical protein
MNWLWRFFLNCLMLIGILAAGLAGAVFLGVFEQQFGTGALVVTLVAFCVIFTAAAITMSGD